MKWDKIQFLKEQEQMNARLHEQENWFLCGKKPYFVQIQKADIEQIYYDGGKPGEVYNFLEDAVEPVDSKGFVVTGTLGEMWPIPVSALKSYDVLPEELSYEPKKVKTKVNTILMAGIQIPANVPFRVKLEQHHIILKGNDGLHEHGDGDFILCEAEKTAEGIHLCTERGFRVINGTLFDCIYQKIEIKEN